MTTPISSMAVTWNVSADTVNTAIGMNVTDTLSAANSRLLSLKVDDVDRFYITKDGTVNYSNAVVTTTISDTITSNNITSNNIISDDITANNITSDYFYVDSGGYMTLAGDTFILNADPNDYIGYYRPSNLWNFFVGGVPEFQIYAGGVTVANNITFNGAIDEKVYALSDAATIDINPDNGTIQYVTLGSSRTITTSNISEGESVTLMLNDTSGGSVGTWSSVSWINNGGVAPDWPADGAWVVVVLWNVNGTVYGAVAGTGA